MIVGLVVVAAVLVVIAILAACDPRFARLAERRASAALSAAAVIDEASVHISRRPFLAQALRGCYREVEVVGRIRLGQLDGVALVGHLVNVHLSLRELIARRARELPCEHIEGRVVLPYDELARVVRLPGLGFVFDGERLRATATMPLPDLAGLAGLADAAGLGGLFTLRGLPGLGALTAGLGQWARVSGRAVLTVRHGTEVWLAIDDVSVAGIALPAPLLAQLVPPAVPVPLATLPFGLRMDDVRPTAAGVVVEGSADAVVLRDQDRLAAAGERPLR